MLSGCKGNIYKKDLLCDTLCSPYTASADIVFSGKTEDIIGKISISKDEDCKVTFIEPSSYSNVTIYGDCDGNADAFTFEFAGIPASVPKSLASELSLLFSLFSDTIPNRISSLDKECFVLCDDNQASYDPKKDLAEVFFSENGTDYLLVYDTLSGTPLSISAGNDTISVYMEFTDFNSFQK